MTYKNEVVSCIEAYE